MIDRSRAEQLDADDPLAAFRDRFVVDDLGTIYLDGNSLGRLPIATRDRLRELVDQWGSELVSAWHEWIDLPERVGDLLATEVLGARQGEVIVCDSTTVNLFKLGSAVLETRQGAVVTDRGNFPTDRYVLEGLARRHGRELRLFDADPLRGPQPEDVAPAADAALICLSHVDYRSGAVADIEAITHASPAPVLWDLSHSVGVVPIDLERNGVELAVGCTYKYLNAGPGAPAFLYVREELQGGFANPIQGWFGQRQQFLMGPAYDPEPGIRRFLAGTPPILGLVAVEEGVRLVGEAGLERLSAKAAALTELIVEMHDAHLAELGFELATPRDPAMRGGQVSLRHPEGWPICRALIEREGVIPDFREPDTIRLGVPPLYTGFTDAYDALDRMRTLVVRGGQKEFAGRKSRVT